MVNGIINALLLANLLVSIILLIQLLLSSQRYRLADSAMEKTYREEDMPTVSLCIPARNETHALADCLVSALSSDYPKLEIIVLDDCSQDTTSQVIRGFAHDGVRFVKGDMPSDGWLGKNNAYQVLSQQARGEYLVFMSVDTRIETKTISQIVGYMQLKKLSMMSILPRRYDGLRSSVVFAPLRYFWQLLLPLKINTPLATSIWSIRADSLQQTGGFETFRDDIRVENTIASQLEHKNQYRFLVANNDLAVHYEKKWASQVQTAIRLWYPGLGKNVGLGLLTLVAHFVLFVLPFLVFVSGLLDITSGSAVLPLSFVLSLCASFLHIGLYVAYIKKTKRMNNLSDVLVVFTSVFLLPFLAIQEMVLIIVSFVQYKRGKVDWKGRNVCYPVVAK